MQTAYKRNAKRALVHITLNLIVYLPRCFFLWSPFSLLLEIQIEKKKIHKVCLRFSTVFIHQIISQMT